MSLSHSWDNGKVNIWILRFIHENETREREFQIKSNISISHKCALDQKKSLSCARLLKDQFQLAAHTWNVAKLNLIFDEIYRWIVCGARMDEMEEFFQALFRVDRWFCGMFKTFKWNLTNHFIFKELLRIFYFSKYFFK